MATLVNNAPEQFGFLVVPVLVIFVSVVTLGLWAARQLTTPLRSFADAAETYGFESEPEPLPENGPQEVRSLARALNNMRARIKKLVDERTHMLASVGHDLRTPITRLRLRTEFMEPGLRATMQSDLDQMTVMVDSALSHLRDGARSNESRIIVDLPSLLQTVCDEFTDLGKDVSYEGPDHALVPLIPGDMHRAVANLVDNATGWGTRALVRLVPPAQGLAIEIEDDGPGIPEEALERVTLPFVRGDKARNLNGTTGFGLGLSVASVVAEAHGGRLHLINKPEGGLIARIELPTLAC
jgi:signal transduction histidine kinase